MIITNYETFLEGKSGKLYRYGCVMLYLNIPNWKSIISRIDESDLYDAENPTHGYETSPHVTILFGLHSNVNDEDVIKVFDGLKSSDLDINIEGIDCFKNKDFDVVKMNVESNKLNELNKELSKLPHTTDYPDYKPHITLAYVLPGKGEKYIEPDYKYKFDNLDKILYKKTNGEKITISVN
jgi:2'-5' RNA ligase